MTSGVKVSDETRIAFEDLIADHRAVKSKHINFSEVIHNEEKAIASKAAALWEKTKFEMGLEGEWGYEAGFVVPVAALEQK